MLINVETARQRHTVSTFILQNFNCINCKFEKLSLTFDAGNLYFGSTAMSTK